MFVLLAVTTLVGLILGLRFKILVLAPTLVLAVGIVAIIWIAEGHHLEATLFTVFGLIVSLQIGYLGGCLFRYPSTSPRLRSTSELVRYR
jgi:hypothetical protein